EAARQQQKYEEAAKYLLRLQEDDGQKAESLFDLMVACREQGDFDTAWEICQTLLKSSPQNAAVHEQAAFLLASTGDRWAAADHYLVLIRSGEASLEELTLLADPDRPVERRTYLESLRKQHPADFLIQRGIAAHLFWEGFPEQARQQLRILVKTHPRDRTSQALLGELLLEGSPAEFCEWHRSLPEALRGDQEIRFVEGLWARRQNHPGVAAACFLDTVRMRPEHRRAMSQLVGVMDLLGHAGAERVRERTDLLIQISQGLDRILTDPTRSTDNIRNLAELLERCGRHWESCAWALFARQQDSSSPWPAEVFRRLTPSLVPELPQTVAAQQLAEHVPTTGLTAFTTAEALLPAGLLQRADVDTAVSSGHAAIRFEESDAGLTFTYLNGNDPRTPGVRMFEQTGGGVAVLDFDGDEFPDVFLTQGGTWPTGSDTPLPTAQENDALFRNVRGTAFRLISEEAVPVESGYGQGCAAADLNQDGFQDLYVANVGRNQLLLNMGDGTFLDVTEEAGLSRHDWTTSVAAVDLNGDTLPDLFDVNYVSGPDVYHRICGGKGCSPAVFDGTPDQVMLNRGDGRYPLSPDAAPAADSKGLGIVVFRSDGEVYPSLFIANDQVANFFLKVTQATAESVQIEDVALLSGLAYNEDGVSMACMGIAIDDADGDLLPDLFVTNFRDEPNTLYAQQSDGLFLDITRATGLKAPGYNYVSWGTQFLDADLDANPDLIVVSGHIDDYRDSGGDYQMNPQFFRNLGRRRFEELTADSSGPFFKTKRLARSMAKLDWNVDGRMEFVVSNIQEPAVITQNLTVTSSAWLSLRLIGTQSERGGLLSSVTLRCGDQTWRKQLTAGDGYQASNQRILHFGLGQSETIDEVRVDWGSGGVSVITDVPARATLIVVEGRDTVCHQTARSATVIPAVFHFPLSPGSGPGTRRR
ncbi:MAG: VCBS repeat-containing protein, partial [Planctomycetaceae bacterium]|nr:VCBS repeat-containing protein [Planctomycetaceae bacterium]